MKWNTNFRFWEPKKDERLVCSYVRKYSYSWIFKINYYDNTTLIGDVTWSKGHRNTKPRRPDVGHWELQNKLNFIKFGLQEAKLAFEVEKNVL